VKVEKWVKTRQLISEEKADWDTEREILTATKRLLSQQKEALQAEIADLEGAGTAADEERGELLAGKDAYEQSGQVLAAQIRGMEEQVLALAPVLPEPLRKKLGPLLVQIPQEAHLAKMATGRRLMNVLGVLAQAEKFNDTATFVGETREIEGGQKVQIRTLYWGLAQAIYVDAQGENAGIGHPTPDGWEFSNDPSLAHDAELLMDIYEGNVDSIEFVGLPVEIR